MGMHLECLTHVPQCSNANKIASVSSYGTLTKKDLGPKEMATKKPRGKPGSVKATAYIKDLEASDVQDSDK